MNRDRKSFLWQEAERLLASHNFTLEKLAEGSYAVKLPSGDSVRFSSLTQIILLFQNLEEVSHEGKNSDR